MRRPPTERFPGLSSFPSSERFTLYQLRPEEIDDWLPHYADLLDGVERRSRGEIMASRFLEACEAGHAQLWTVIDRKDKRLACIVGTDIETTGHGQRQARIVFCTGTGAREWVGLIEEIEAWARANGCKRIKALMRKGWLRHLPGYRVRHVEAEKAL